MFRKRTFIICASHRSGSTLLCEGMRWTWRCGDPKEYLSPVHSVALYQRGDISVDPEQDFPGYIEELMRCQRSENGMFGLKIMWKHLQKLPRKCDIPCAMSDHRRLARSLQKIFGRSHFIWSRRENKTKQAISFLKAKQTGLFTHQQMAQGDRQPDRSRLDYDFDAIQSLVHRFEAEEEHWKKVFKLGRIRPLIITYENIAKDYRGEVERALRHVGVWGNDCEIKQPDRNRKLADDTTAEWYHRYLEDSENSEASRGSRGTAGRSRASE